MPHAEPNQNGGGDDGPPEAADDLAAEQSARMSDALGNLEVCEELRQAIAVQDDMVAGLSDATTPGQLHDRLTELVEHATRVGEFYASEKVKAEQFELEFGHNNPEETNLPRALRSGIIAGLQMRQLGFVAKLAETALALEPMMPPVGH